MDGGGGGVQVSQVGSAIEVSVRARAVVCVQRGVSVSADVGREESGEERCELRMGGAYR